MPRLRSRLPPSLKLWRDKPALRESDEMRKQRSALRLSERGVEAFEAGLGPELSGIVVIPE